MKLLLKCIWDNNYWVVIRDLDYKSLLTAVLTILVFCAVFILFPIMPVIHGVNDYYARLKHEHNRKISRKIDELHK